MKCRVHLQYWISPQCQKFSEDVWPGTLAVGLALLVARGVAYPRPPLLSAISATPTLIGETKSFVGHSLARISAVHSRDFGG